ncbi:hypothetical protein J4050_15100 [Winogradskyella sp. DF17]|uniref:Uncharacterized protein n=1 Tax=Winogradskyella pelagia TaxID=2819984 RepID=A0ABS3T5P8_9FLAO|nr:hypothetical protein [Winogradskyella sp. DF17]MBO3118078.1 hypothetical protein [Winogradskyella sp. DF17]
MEKSEMKKIALILFHVLALLFMIISGFLFLTEVLEESANPRDYIDSFSLSIPRVFSTIAVLIGFLSWLTMVVNWIRKRKLDNYLKLVLFLTSLIIPGLVLLLIKN